MFQGILDDLAASPVDANIVLELSAENMDGQSHFPGYPIDRPLKATNTQSSSARQG